MQATVPTFQVKPSVRAPNREGGSELVNSASPLKIAVSYFLRVRGIHKDDGEGV